LEETPVCHSNEPGKGEKLMRFGGLDNATVGNGLGRSNEKYQHGGMGWGDVTWSTSVRSKKKTKKEGGKKRDMKKKRFKKKSGTGGGKTHVTGYQKRDVRKHPSLGYVKSG